MDSISLLNSIEPSTQTHIDKQSTPINAQLSQTDNPNSTIFVRKSRFGGSQSPITNLEFLIIYRSAELLHLAFMGNKFTDSLPSKYLPKNGSLPHQKCLLEIRFKTQVEIQFSAVLISSLVSIKDVCRMSKKALQKKLQQIYELDISRIEDVTPMSIHRGYNLMGLCSDKFYMRDIIEPIRDAQLQHSHEQKPAQNLQSYDRSLLQQSQIQQQPKQHKTKNRETRQLHRISEKTVKESNPDRIYTVQLVIYAKLTIKWANYSMQQIINSSSYFIEFCCPVSHEFMEIPLILHCGHIFCFYTVFRLTGLNQQKCPLCRREFNLQQARIAFQFLRKLKKEIKNFEELQNRSHDQQNPINSAKYITSKINQIKLRRKSQYMVNVLKMTIHCYFLTYINI